MYIAVVNVNNNCHIATTLVEVSYVVQLYIYMCMHAAGNLSGCV